jgi:hypothetical protein
MTSTNHDINNELRGPADDFILHDSQGWNSGSENPYDMVQHFLDDRRKQPAFSNQLHCIWYCMDSSQNRINAVDQRFFRSVDFRGVTVVAVFTKCDRVFDESQRQALADYEADNELDEPLDPLRVPAEISAEIERRRDEIYESRNEERVEQVKEILGKGFECVFVSKYPQGKFINPLSTCVGKYY